VGDTYRKTATIEATQWFKMGDHPAVVMESAPNRYADEGIPWCPTMEGGHIVTPGDWIATGIKGEHWPIKPDVFAETYTPVSAALDAAEARAVATLVEAVERLNAACDAIWNDHERLEKNTGYFAGQQPWQLKEAHMKAISEAQQALPSALAPFARKGE